MQGGDTAFRGGMYVVGSTRQPAEIEYHTIGGIGRGNFPQPGMVLPHGPANAIQPGLCQPCVGGVHRLLLNVQGQYPAGGACQAAQKLRIMAVAAGGIDVQTARCQPRGQKIMAEAHGGKVRHPPPHQTVPGGHKIKFGGQGPGSFFFGQ